MLYSTLKILKQVLILSRRYRVTIENAGDNQCVSDPDLKPDPDWIRNQLGLWIRIMNPVRIHAGRQK
jgi:hypothetical protein